MSTAPVESSVRQKVILRPHTWANLDRFLVWYADPELARLTRHDQKPLSPTQIRLYFEGSVLPTSAAGQSFGIHTVDSGELIAPAAPESCDLSGLRPSGQLIAPAAPESCDLSGLRPSGQLIGTCALTDFTSDGRFATLRILIGERAYWGRGYGTAAVQVLASYGFDCLGLHEIVLGVFDFNARAIRSYEKVGFRRASLVRLAMPPGHPPASELLMVLEASTFHAQKVTQHS